MKIDPRSLKNKSKEELSEMLKSEDDDIVRLALGEMIHRDFLVTRQMFRSQPSDQISLFPDLPLDLDNISVAISESQQAPSRSSAAEWSSTR